ncbi:MAG: carbamoyltransferase [Patescibacteria group bacterium]
MNILGISAFYHDSAACLVSDGKIVAAAQEERFTRKKHDERFPNKAIEYCLAAGGISSADVDYAVFYEKPFLKFERLLETYLAVAPRGIKSFIAAMPAWLREKLWIKEILWRELGPGFRGEILFSEHHRSHAASAFFPSPFERAAILTLDGVGEWATTSWGVGRGNKIELWADIYFPHSLGMLYSAFTYYAGFKVNSGEYKLMGLAPYGEPKYKRLIYDTLIDVKDNGSFRLNMDYFNYAEGLTMTNARFHALFGGEPRKPDTILTQKDMDVAASIQTVMNEIMLKISRHIRKETGEKNLVMAGGVALNCVANGKLLQSGVFNDVWIQPAAGDAGGALGAALSVWHEYLGNKKLEIGSGKLDGMLGAYLGPEFADEEIKRYLDERAISYEQFSEYALLDKISDAINAGKVIGWFQGRMEFGPRALGARSIIGDARSREMQSMMNLRIKFRESFRPFAPSVLYEHVSEYFDMSERSPYMLFTADVKNDKRLPLSQKDEQAFGLEKLKKPRSKIPAVTHVDYSARVQTVHHKTNPRYHKLIARFNEKYGCPVIVNTSFNVRGEPIVCTPDDAYRCFMRTNIDYLAMGNFLLDKKAQPEFKDAVDWHKEFDLD